MHCLDYFSAYHTRPLMPSDFTKQPAAPLLLWLTVAQMHTATTIQVGGYLPTKGEENAEEATSAPR